MKLGVIINCVGPSYSENVKELFEKFMIDIEPKLSSLGFESVCILPDDYYVYSRINKLPMDRRDTLKRNNKGYVVKQCFEELKNFHCVDAIIHIDGSKKFDLSAIIDVSRLLIDPSIDAVLTNRKISGTSPERELIEFFEKFLISTQFDRVNIKDIEDGQSGCWGLKCRIIEGLNILAEGYGIESDILIGLLENEYMFIWTPVEVNITGISEFKVEDHVKKIKVLCKRIMISKEELLNSLNKFEKVYSSKIKEVNKKLKRDVILEYISLIEKINPKEFR